MSKSAMEEREVRPNDVNGDVPHDDLADGPLRRTTVGMAVQDEIGSMSADRRPEPARPEKRPYLLRLTYESLGDPSVVQQYDSPMASCDRL